MRASVGRLFLPVVAAVGSIAVVGIAHAGEPITETQTQTQTETEAGADLEIEVGAEQEPAVYGGTAANYCGWPTAVFVSFGGSACSGTLVEPNIVITAAHCPNSVSGRSAVVSFGEGFGGGERDVAATCFSNPSWTGAVGPQDYGYCLLDTPVTDVPIIPPAWGCDVSALTPGREVVIVGFGQSDNGGSGSKREATTTIVNIGDQAFIGGQGQDACQGDSGGPVYVKMDSAFGGDDTWRVFGITSGGGECGQGGIFALMHVAIPWVEQHSGIDITPCQNSQGDWEPTPDCNMIPLDPAAGAGNWGNGCSGGPISGLGGLCGEPFGTGEDPDAPSVVIVNPADGTEFEADGGGTADVQLGVAADDGEGFGVQEVEILINGASFPGNIDYSEPYSWDLVMPEGQFVIEAIARDYSGNEGEATPIGIGVGMPAPEVPAGTGDEGGEDGGDDGPDTGVEDGDTGWSPGGDSLTVGCSCTTDDRQGGGGALGAVLLLALVGWRRRSS